MSGMTAIGALRGHDTGEVIEWRGPAPYLFVDMSVATTLRAHRLAWSQTCPPGRRHRWCGSWSWMLPDGGGRVRAAQYWPHGDT